MSLETKNYVASPTDVEKITRAVLQATSTGTSGRASYFRALIETTRHELDMAPRQRPGANDRIKPEVRDTHLRALEAVHQRFYAVVDKVARERLAPGKNAARELNRRTNFARSAMSTVRAWIRVGNDIGSLAAGSTTKAMLAVDTRRKRTPSAHILTKQAHRHAERLESVVVKLVAADGDAARSELEALRDSIDALLEKMPPKKGRAGLRAVG